jgi:predicted RNase H-like HicB family nuclease
LTIYIALLRKDPESDYGVDFPDFPSCITAGSTLEEAREMAAEALEFHIEGMLEEDLPIPEPSSLEAVMADPENAEAVAFPASVPDRLTGAGQLDLTLSMADLEKLDALAEKRGSSRAAPVTEAVRRLLAGDKEHHAA